MAKRPKTISEQIAMELEQLASAEEPVETAPVFSNTAEAADTAKPEEPAETSLNDILESLDRSYIDLPFETSFFEMTKFNIAEQVTPARAYTYIGEQLFDYLDRYFSEKKNYAEIEQRISRVNKLISSDDTTEKERVNLANELDVMMINFYRTKHNVNEALQMVSFLYNQYIKFPKITRQEFEDEEFEHFKSTLTEDNTYALKLMTVNAGTLERNLTNFIAKKIGAVQ